MPARVCSLHDNLTVIFNSECDSSASVMMVDDANQVIRIAWKSDIRELRDFFIAVCQDLDDYRNHRKALDTAEQRCKECPVDDPDVDPVPELCRTCDNLTIALEAFERYR